MNTKELPLWTASKHNPPRNVPGRVFLERCSHCGQFMPKAHKHRLDYGKFVMLRQIAAMNNKGVEWVKVQRDGALIRDGSIEIQGDDVHALRLTWFGLAERKARRTGLYRVTDKGRAFLAGLETVPDWLKEIKGRVTETSEDRVSVQQIKGVILDREYWDQYAKSGGEAA